MDREIVFGIDLGTTYSCVAYVDEHEKADTIKNAEGQMTTPSVIYFESKEKQIVGDEAKNYAITEPEKSVEFIKREMGTDYRRELFGEPYSPQELSSKILKKLIQDANDSLKEIRVLEPDDVVIKAVITCPAYFGMAEKNATKQAGELAGIEVMDIINEPTAAALYYGRLDNKDGGSKRVLVYDLGGGTFDVTIMDVTENSVNVICTGGDAQLGGKDWDEATVNFLLERWQEENNSSEDITLNLQTSSEMHSVAEKSKKTLTVKDEAKVNFTHDGEHFRTVLTRNEFDEFTSDLLNKTIQMTDKCIEDMKSKDASKQIDEIILVGGSCRMPQIKDRIEKEYGLPVHMFDPDGAVAKGAAIHAQSILGQYTLAKEISEKTGSKIDEIMKSLNEKKTPSDILNELGKGDEKLESETNVERPIIFNNVSSRTYGLLANNSMGGKVIVNIIHQNDTIPVTKKEKFFSLDETGATLKLYETIAKGDITDPEEIGRLTPVFTSDMTFSKPTPVGTEIDVEMTLNNSGLLTIVAEEMLNHTRLDCEYTIEGGMTDKELKVATDRTSNSTVE